MKLPNPFFLMILLLLFTNTILAQEKTADDADTVDETVERDAPAGQDRPAAVMVNGGSYPQMCAAKRFQLTQLFAVEVEEITWVCELDEAQITKLNVGAKGAVKKLMGEWEKIAGPQFGGRAAARVDIEKNDEESDAKEKPVDEVATVEFTDADQIDDTALRIIMMGNDGNPFRIDPPNGKEFWKKTLASILSESQSARLDQFRQNRDREKRIAMIGFWLSTMKLELGLTDEQHAKLSLLVTPLMEKADVRSTVFYQPSVFFYYASKVDENMLGEFLSVAQLQKWKLSMTEAKLVSIYMEIEAQGDEAPQKEAQPAENDHNP